MDADTLKKIHSEALTLPERERAELAYALVRSLDEPADSDAVEEWDKELVRRLNAIDSGTAKLIDREELQRRLRERLERR